MGQELVLFQSALGLRPAVLEWADHLRAAGHAVHTPDLFDGEVFDKLEDGMRKRDALGIPGLIRRAQAAVASLPAGIVLAGFSMGAAAAQFLAANRRGAKAAIRMHAALAPAEAGPNAWPRGVPVQIHYAEHDPWVDPTRVNALADAVRGADTRVDVYTYPCAGHLFADHDVDDYDPVAARVMPKRVLNFVASL